MPPEAAGAAVPAIAIELTEVSKFYRVRRRKLLKATEGVSFDAGKAEIVALVGESGCGKSTLARIVTGLDRASSGEIRMVGADIAQLSAHERPRRLLQSIQMIFQNPESTLNPSHSAAFSIRRSLRNFRICNGKAAINQRLHELLELVRLSPSLAERKPEQLSGGQKQRIAIARAFAANPL